MKAWGWISMRRSFEDAMNKAFEETTMKNMPIDQFWSFKWRNGAQNWNLSEKLSKIGPVGNFDFWSKVNAKKSKSTSLWSKSTDTGPGRFWVSGLGHESSIGVADVILWRGLGLTWTCLRGCWRGLMTSSGDVRWRQQKCFGAWKARAKSAGAWRGCRNPGGACDVVWPSNSQAK